MEKDVQIQVLKQEAEFWKNQFMQLCNIINNTNKETDK